MKQLTIILLVLIMGACSAGQGPRKPSASGKTGELLVVMNKARWEGAAGDMVKGVFSSYVPMLPQAEPYFNIFQIEPAAFAKLFETHRNILFVEFDPSLEKGRIEAKRDAWSYPQMVINVKVPNEEVLQKIMESNAESFIGYYLQKERERLINAYSRMINHQARNVVRNNLGLDITVPEGYFVAKQEPNFVWLRQTGTREDLELGVLISVMPYIHPEIDFSHQKIWERRDSITRANIPGTFPDTYMTTYPEIPPIFREINFNELYAVEGRGLWRIKEDFMGGPFINITFVDQKNSRLINIDGFVYAPKFDKRDYMRQVEALIYSIKVYEGDETNTNEEPVT